MILCLTSLFLSSCEIGHETLDYAETGKLPIRVPVYLDKNGFYQEIKFTVEKQDGYGIYLVFLKPNELNSSNTLAQQQQRIDISNALSKLNHIHNSPLSAKELIQFEISLYHAQSGKLIFKEMVDFNDKHRKIDAPYLFDDMEKSVVLVDGTGMLDTGDYILYFKNFSSSSLYQEYPIRLQISEPYIRKY